ncbi:MAG: putative membrane protein [Myxococcota bacterium]
MVSPDAPDEFVSFGELDRRGDHRILPLEVVAGPQRWSVGLVPPAVLATLAGPDWVATLRARIADGQVAVCTVALEAAPA